MFFPFLLPVKNVTWPFSNFPRCDRFSLRMCFVSSWLRRGYFVPWLSFFSPLTKFASVSVVFFLFQTFCFCAQLSFPPDLGDRDGGLLFLCPSTSLTVWSSFWLPVPGFCLCCVSPLFFSRIVLYSMLSCPSPRL